MSEFHAAVSYRCTSTFTQSLYNAAVHDRGRYMDRYNTADMAKNIANAQMHAVLDKAAEIYQEGIVNTNSSALAPLYAAFNAVYPGKYSYCRFGRYMRLVCVSGAEKLVKDKRRGNNHKISDVIKKWLLDAMSSGKKIWSHINPPDNLRIMRGIRLQDTVAIMGQDQLLQDAAACVRSTQRQR